MDKELRKTLDEIIANTKDSDTREALAIFSTGLISKQVNDLDSKVSSLCNAMITLLQTQEKIEKILEDLKNNQMLMEVSYDKRH